MKFKFPQLQTRTALLSMSASMIAAGAAVAAYGPAIAHDYPKEFIAHPLFAFSFLLLGIGGVIIYLSKALFNRFTRNRLVRTLILLPFALYLIFLMLSGSPMVMAWVISTTIVAAYSLFKTEESYEDEGDSILGPYASLFLLLMGGIIFIFGNNLQVSDSVVAIWALILGVLGVIVSTGRLQRAKTIIRFVSGAFIIVLGIYGILLGHALIHAILILPLGVALLLEGYLMRMRFGQQIISIKNDESSRVNQFQDVTELNAWAVFLFALIHVFLTPDLNGDLFFYLFIVAFISFVYQYRFKSAKENTYKSFFINSFKNLVILVIAAHFTGGIHSPFNWFFAITLLSGVISKSKTHLHAKLGLITAYYIFEIAREYLIGHVATYEILDIFILQYFIVIVTTLYIQRIATLQNKIDAGLTATNKNLSLVISREREAKSVISSQAIELRQAQDQIQKIVNSVADAVVAVDGVGDVVFMNESARDLTSFSGSSIRSISVKDVLPFKNDNTKEIDINIIIQNLLKEKEAVGSKNFGADDDDREIFFFPEETYIEPKSKERQYLEGAVVDLGIDSGNIRLVITFRNINYRREVDQLKTDFMSVAAHQLRTPLSSIRWHLELLNDPSEGKLKKNQKMFSENAYTSLMRMIGLVNGLLAVTRVESSRVPSNPEPMVIPALTQEILDEMSQGIKKKGIAVHVKFEENIPAVQLDPQLSREVFMNLISNAVRYSKKKGEILISITNEKNEIHWSIADNGIGIPEKQQEKIFKKFYRASNASSFESKGTGLGLYLAKFIATQWNGRLWFESEEGKGSTFHVTVPHEGMNKKEGEINLHA